MSLKDKVAMLCCYAIVVIPLAAMVWMCWAPDAQVNQVVAYIEGSQK